MEDNVHFHTQIWTSFSTSKLKSDICTTATMFVLQKKLFRCFFSKNWSISTLGFLHFWKLSEQFTVFSKSTKSLICSLNKQENISLEFFTRTLFQIHCLQSNPYSRIASYPESPPKRVMPHVDRNEKHSPIVHPPTLGPLRSAASPCLWEKSNLRRRYRPR